MVFVEPVDGDLRVYCSRCAEEMLVNLPKDVRELGAAVRSFIGRHRPCQLRATADRLEADREHDEAKP